MTADQFQQAKAVLRQALECGPAERSAFVAEACGADSALRTEVESLLEHHDRTPDSFLAPQWTAGLAVAAADDAAGADDEPDAEALLGATIGPFRVERLIGEGGMGVVYEAVQEGLRRRVALKVMRPQVVGRGVRRRFDTESRILAQLQHPNVARIYEAGAVEPVWPEGTPSDKTAGWARRLPYFAMEFVAGERTITEFVRERRLGVREKLRMFANVCDAVQHGHQKGIIHRDLKPANILVDGEGEPKVIDFGIARAMDADELTTTARTQPGQVLGTYQYMSPEQADGDRVKIDTRSDVYSLGVVLYELLTDRLPYKVPKGSLTAIARAIREHAPQRPSSLDSKLRGDLETVLLKALEKEPARRYQSAGPFGDDLHRVLAREPIAARPPSLAYVVSRYARRHVWQTVATAFAILSVTVTLVFLTIDSQHRAASAKDVKRAAYRGLLQSAGGALRINDGAGAKYQLGLVDPDARRSWEWKHLFSRVHQSVQVLRTPDDRKAATAASLDRECRLLARGATPGPRIDIFDLATDKLVRTVEAEALLDLYHRGFPEIPAKDLGAGRAHLSPTGDCVAVVASTGAGAVISLQDPRTAREARAWRVEGGAKGLRFHPEWPWLAGSVDRREGNELRFWLLDSTVGGAARPIEDEPHYLRVPTGNPGVY